MNRVAVMSIIGEKEADIASLNEILHKYSDSIVGRMGIPYRKRDINIICIALDAPQDTISSLSGAVGKLKGISVKTAFSSALFDD